MRQLSSTRSSQVGVRTPTANQLTRDGTSRSLSPFGAASRPQSPGQHQLSITRPLSRASGAAELAGELSTPELKIIAAAHKLLTVMASYNHLENNLEGVSTREQLNNLNVEKNALEQEISELKSILFKSAAEKEKLRGLKDNLVKLDIKIKKLTTEIGKVSSELDSAKEEFRKVLFKSPDFKDLIECKNLFEARKMLRDTSDDIKRSQAEMDARLKKNPNTKILENPGNLQLLHDKALEILGQHAKDGTLPSEYAKIPTPPPSVSKDREIQEALNITHVVYTDLEWIFGAAIFDPVQYNRDMVGLGKRVLYGKDATPATERWKQEHVEESTINQAHRLEIEKTLLQQQFQVYGRMVVPHIDRAIIPHGNENTITKYSEIHEVDGDYEVSATVILAEKGVNVRAIKLEGGKMLVPEIHRAQAIACISYTFTIDKSKIMRRTGIDPSNPEYKADPEPPKAVGSILKSIRIDSMEMLNARRIDPNDLADDGNLGHFDLVYSKLNMVMVNPEYASRSTSRATTPAASVGVGQAQSDIDHTVFSFGDVGNNSFASASGNANPSVKPLVLERRGTYSPSELRSMRTAARFPDSSRETSRRNSIDSDKESVFGENDAPPVEVSNRRGTLVGGLGDATEIITQEMADSAYDLLAMFNEVESLKGSLKSLTDNYKNNENANRADEEISAKMDELAIKGSEFQKFMSDYAAKRGIKTEITLSDAYQIYTNAAGFYGDRAELEISTSALNSITPAVTPQSSRQVSPQASPHQHTVKPPGALRPLNLADISESNAYRNVEDIFSPHAPGALSHTASVLPSTLTSPLGRSQAFAAVAPPSTIQASSQTVSGALNVAEEHTSATENVTRPAKLLTKNESDAYELVKLCVDREDLKIKLNRIYSRELAKSLANLTTKLQNAAQTYADKYSRENFQIFDHAYKVYEKAWDEGKLSGDKLVIEEGGIYGRTPTSPSVTPVVSPANNSLVPPPAAAGLNQTRGALERGPEDSSSRLWEWDDPEQVAAIMRAGANPHTHDVSKSIVRSPSSQTSEKVKTKVIMRLAEIKRKLEAPNYKFADRYMFYTKQTNREHYRRAIREEYLNIKEKNLLSDSAVLEALVNCISSNESIGDDEASLRILLTTYYGFTDENDIKLVVNNYKAQPLGFY